MPWVWTSKEVEFEADMISSRVYLVQQANYSSQGRPHNSATEICFFTLEHREIDKKA